MASSTGKRTKPVQIGVRLDERTKAQLERLAAKESRSVSDYVRLLILRALGRAAA